MAEVERTELEKLAEVEFASKEQVVNTIRSLIFQKILIVRYAEVRKLQGTVQKKLGSSYEQIAHCGEMWRHRHSGPQNYL